MIAEMARFGRLAAGLAAAALLLAACSGDEVAAPPCPNVRISDELGRVTKFRDGPGRDLTDVVLEAEIADFDGFCVTDPRAGASGRVEVELVLSVDSARGPANVDRQGEYSFFVALLTRDGQILKKPVFPGDVSFSGNGRRVRTTEEMFLEIPLRPGETGADYDILVGFQLSDQELQFMRRQRSTR